MKKHISFLSIAFASSMILFYSCSKSDSNTTTPTPTPAPTVVGKWNRGGSTGWTFTFNSDNTYTFFDSAQPTPLESGTYSAANNVLNITAKAAYFCSQYLTGKYTYSFSSDSITFSPITDTCSTRITYMGGKFKKQ